MACPKCQCKTTYHYDVFDGYERESCAACYYIFFTDEGYDEEEYSYEPEPEDFMIQGGKG